MKCPKFEEIVHKKMSAGVILLNYMCFFNVKNGLFRECGPWDPPQGPLSVKYHFLALELGLPSINWHASMFYSKFRSKNVKKYTPEAKQSKTRFLLKVTLHQLFLLSFII